MAQRNYRRWKKLPVTLRAVITGLVIALIPANVWPPLLLSMGVPLAATIEVVFFGFSGGQAAVVPLQERAPLARLLSAEVGNRQANGAGA